MGRWEAEEEAFMREFLARLPDQESQIQDTGPLEPLSIVEYTARYIDTKATVELAWY